MVQRGTVVSKLIPAAIFIILEVAAINMLKSSSSIQNVWINRLSHNFLASTWGFGQKVSRYFSLDRQNDLLAQENFLLSKELDRYKRLVSEYKLATSFTGLKSDAFSYIPATIVKMSRNSQHNYIIIDKGSEDGIVPHSGIITSNGAIGIIEAVDKHYSYGISFFNTKIGISVRLGRSGTVSTMSWDGISGNRANIGNIPPYAGVAPGDTVWTSGVSSIFPGDIPLGTVEKVSEKAALGNAEILLFQDFSTMKYVTVVSNSSIGEIESLENKASAE